MLLHSVCPNHVTRKILVTALLPKTLIILNSLSSLLSLLRISLVLKSSWKEEKLSCLVCLSMTKLVGYSVIKKWNLLTEISSLGASKPAPIVTPLMEFIRQKRATVIGSQVIIAFLRRILFQIGVSRLVISGFC